MIFRIRTILILMILFVFGGIFSIHYVDKEERTYVKSQISDSILIIDPGHGGDDGGAVSKYSNLKESEINLDISLKLNSLCHLYGIQTLMTRKCENINYPSDVESIPERKVWDQNSRLRLIWDCPNGILYSIHQNFYPMEAPFGPEVLYGHNEESKELGVMLQNNLQESLCPQSRRVAAEIDDNIYLLRKCNCTSVLVECGFLSNKNEALKLQNDVYQKKMAIVLATTYLQYAVYDMK